MFWEGPQDSPFEGEATRWEEEEMKRGREMGFTPNTDHFNLWLKSKLEQRI